MAKFTTQIYSYGVTGTGDNLPSPLWKIDQYGIIWPNGSDLNDPDCAFTIDIDNGTLFSPSRQAYFGAADFGLLQTVSDDKVLTFSLAWTPTNSLSFQVRSYSDLFLRYAIPGPLFQYAGVTITKLTEPKDYFCWFPCHNLDIVTAFPPSKG